jgi:hypothetical protein
MKAIKILCIIILSASLTSVFSQNLNLDSGLVAFYPFNGNATDESWNGNDGLVNGAILTSDRFGTLNKAYGFNGLDNYILVPDSPTLAFNGNLKSEFTLCAWVNTAVSPVKQGIVGRWGGTSGIRYLLFILENGTGDVHTTTTGTPFAAGTVIPAEEWHFLVGGYNSETDFLNLYLDGDLDKTVAAINIFGTDPDISKDLEIGRFDNGYYFNGKIDDVRIYNRSLTRSEILQLFHEGGWLSSTNESTKPSLIKIFPNPAADKIYLQAEREYRYTVNDFIGRRVFSGNTIDNPVLTFDKTGVYFVTFMLVNQSLKTEKIVIL